MNIYFADTNIFIRFLTGTPLDQAAKSKQILEDVEKGKLHIFVSILVFAEIVYVLESVYKLEKAIIAEKLKYFLSMKNLKTENKQLLGEALEIYESAKIDFTDSYLAVIARKSKNAEILSFDTDFDKLSFVKRKITT